MYKIYNWVPHSLSISVIWKEYSMCSLVTELYVPFEELQLQCSPVTTSPIWQYFRCCLLIGVLLRCCFCLCESFAQFFGGFLGSLGVHVFLTSLELWFHEGHARLCCSMLSRGQMSSFRELYFCLLMDKNNLYELLGLSAISFFLSFFFSFCLRIDARIIKKFDAYVPNF